VRELTLWTIQSLGAWSRLQKDGVLRADGRRVFPVILPAIPGTTCTVIRRAVPEGL